MIDLSTLTIEQVWQEFRRRGCAVVIVQPDTLHLLHPTDAEDIAWFAINRELDRLLEEEEHNQ